jgi:two-component system phosphate regulon sensor histidine kinase PhoR
MNLLAEDKAISVSCEAGQPVPVKGNRVRLKQVIVNLLDNAIKYTPANGAVHLRVRAVNGHAVLEDTGIGIPVRALPQVFERFYRVDSSRTANSESAGLGLAIVKAICTAHGAEVEVQSAMGSGSCFRVRLPLSQS